MDTHDKAHYALHGLFGACILGGAWMMSGLPSKTDLPPSYPVSTAQIRALPFGKHSYRVFVAGGSGELPYALADAIEAQGGSATTESDMLAHEGVWISPDTAEGHALADALSKVIGEPVKVGNADDGAFEIGVGRPMHKAVK